jgi:hypothetical protein
MKVITRTTTVTTEKGTVVNMTVTATRGYELVDYTTSLDGWVCEGKKMEVINKTKINIAFNDQKIEGQFSILPTHVQKEKGIYGVFASKIGLSETKYNELKSVVNAAIAEAETDENWMKYQTKKAQSQKEEEEYQANVKMIDNAMTLNGRSY